MENVQHYSKKDKMPLNLCSVVFGTFEKKTNAFSLGIPIKQIHAIVKQTNLNY